MKIINLKSEILTIKQILKKTKAEMFKDLKIGDKIQLSILVEKVGGHRGRSYAPIIQIENLQTNVIVFKTFNEIDPILSNFELL